MAREAGRLQGTTIISNDRRRLAYSVEVFRLAALRLSVLPGVAKEKFCIVIWEQFPHQPQSCLKSWTEKITWFWRDPCREVQPKSWKA
jgi:hypothetical protein